MKFCTFFSDSHKKIFDQCFIPSFPFESGLDLIVRKVDQHCQSGNLFDVGWVNSMTAKQEFLNEMLKRNEGEIMVFSDVDIRFYQPIKSDIEDLLGGYDIIFQKDHFNNPNGRCAGFFATRSTQKIRALFARTLERLRESAEKRKGERVGFDHSEQNAVNREIEQTKDLKWGFLPERYYTHGLYEQGVKNPKEPRGFWWHLKHPSEKDRVYVPLELTVHHANWCVGTDLKIELLNFIKAKHDWKKKQNEKGAQAV